MVERGFPRNNGAAGNATCSIGALEVYVVVPNPAPTLRPGGVVQSASPAPCRSRVISGLISCSPFSSPDRNVIARQAQDSINRQTYRYHDTNSGMTRAAYPV